MQEHANLRKYLLRGFLLTLVCIGITQLIVNALLGTFILPMLEHVLQMDGLLSSADIKSAYFAIFQGILVFLGQRLFPLSNDVLTRIFGVDMVQSMSQLTDKLSTGQSVGYIFMMILFLVIVVAIWLFPYLLGATVYARFVSNKVAELKQKRIAENKEQEKQKNLLLSDVAHDIKTPITTVAGFSRALSDGTIPPEQQQEYLDAVYSKSMQVSDLVTLLFEYVKLDSAGYQLHKTRVDACELLRGCIVRYYTDFEEKEMELDLNIPEESIYLEVDKMQFERAINNLLTNTIKHNPKGTPIFISLNKEKDQAVFQISDKGEFIERETARHLFEPFVQGDQSRTSGKGSGLGLSITKKIVEMHGGRIMLIQYLDAEKHGKVKTFKISMRL